MPWFLDWFNVSPLLLSDLNDNYRVSTLFCHCPNSANYVLVISHFANFCEWIALMKSYLTNKTEW